MQSLKSGDEQELRRMREQLEALQARPNPPSIFKLPLCASFCGLGRTCSASSFMI